MIPSLLIVLGSPGRIKSLCWYLKWSYYTDSVPMTTTVVTCECNWGRLVLGVYLVERYVVDRPLSSVLRVHTERLTFLVDLCKSIEI